MTEKGAEDRNGNGDAYEPPAGDLASATGFARSQCDNIIIIVVGAEDERVTSFND